MFRNNRAKNEQFIILSEESKKKMCDIEWQTEQTILGQRSDREHQRFKMLCFASVISLFLVSFLCFMYIIKSNQQYRLIIFIFVFKCAKIILKSINLTLNVFNIRLRCVWDAYLLIGAVCFLVSSLYAMLTDFQLQLHVYHTDMIEASVYLCLVLKVIFPKILFYTSKQTQFHRCRAPQTAQQYCTEKTILVIVDYRQHLFDYVK